MHLLSPRHLLLPLFLLFPSCLTPSPPTPLRVLLLGDSISIGYTPFVRELLADRAHVARAMKPEGDKIENCCGTNHAVEHLDRWLAQEGGEWDVIHFNFGLHDLKRVDPDTGKNSNDPEDPHQADPERYERQLRWIVGRLKETGARLVFATTTPVPPGVSPYRGKDDPITYNRVARRVMEENGIPVNDLFAYVTANPSMIREKNVHYTEQGSRVLAAVVARAIEEQAARP